MGDFELIPRFTLFSIGRTPVTVGSLVVSLLVIAGAILLSRLIGSVLRRLRSRSRAPASIYIVEKVATYGLVIAGLVAAVDMLGVNLSSLAVFAGALGVGVGLGLQGIVKEFVSGLVVVFEGALQVGDYIELERGGRGEVREIGPRATRIRNNDNVDILIPNSKLIEERVTSWTYKGAARRMHIPFAVPYGSDKTLVREVILAAAHEVPFTLPDQGDRRAQVWLVGFGEAGLNFELLVWPELSAVKRPNAATAAYTWAIEEALCKAGLQVPYRQMDLHLRSVFEREGDEALKALGLKQTRHAERKAASPGGANDAIDDLAAGRERDIAKAQANPDLHPEPLEPDPDEIG
ncbi:MAG: transporter [Caulobacteraceae bacterium]|nr:transporter [Caulobacteraceae bacterium]